MENFPSPIRPGPSHSERPHSLPPPTNSFPHEEKRVKMGEQKRKSPLLGQFKIGLLLRFLSNQRTRKKSFLELSFWVCA